MIIWNATQFPCILPICLVFDSLMWTVETLQICTVDWFTVPSLCHKKILLECYHMSSLMCLMVGLAGGFTQTFQGLKQRPCLKYKARMAAL